YGKALAHYRHAALVEVAKGSRLLAAAYSATNNFSRITSLLHRHLRYARKGLTVLLQCGGVADHENFWMSGNSQIILDSHPAGAVRLHLQPLARWRGRDPGRPDHGLARNSFTCDHYAVRVDLIHAVSEPDLDTQFLESLLCSLGEVFRKGTENPRRHIDQHNS